MGFSPLANASRRIADRGRYNVRQSKISGFTIHHNAGVDSYSEAWNPNKEVSANYWILNDGTILGNVDEVYRAWTTGSAGYPAGAQSDHRNITVEVSNSPEGVRSGTWAISAAAYSSLVALIADVFKRHNLGTVKRAKVGGVAVHQDFVPTACPGPYIMSHLSDIISKAEQLRVGEPEPEKKEEPGDIEMRTIFNIDDKNNDTRRAAVGEFTFQVQRGPVSTRERKLWGAPVNVTQGEWNAIIATVNTRRKMIGLEPIKGTYNEFYNPAGGDKK